MDDLTATDFNRWQLTKRRKELAEDIPIEAAQIFVRLLDKNRVPDWVRAMARERDMRLLAGKV